METSKKFEVMFMTEAREFLLRLDEKSRDKIIFNIEFEYIFMQIERTNKEILIRLSSGTDLVGLQRIFDYLRFREIASKSKAAQEQIDELAAESKASWWSKNKSRFVK